MLRQIGLLKIISRAHLKFFKTVVNKLFEFMHGKRVLGERSGELIPFSSV